MANTYALLPIQLTLCQYTPATGTELSSLRIYINAAGAESSAAVVTRNIVLKDAAADAAWTWIQTNTPAALQF